MQSLVFARARLASIVARLSMSVALSLLALLLATAGIGLLVAALWLWLVTLMAPPMAALVCGITAFVIAGLVALIGRLVLRARSPSPVAPSAMSAAVGGGAPPSVAAIIGTELGAAGSTWMKGHTLQVLLAAAAAGFALGVSPRLRAALLRMMR